eukprot:5180503-Pyramimonas_sp.AAC.1
MARLGKKNCWGKRRSSTRGSCQTRQRSYSVLRGRRCRGKFSQIFKFASPSFSRRSGAGTERSFCDVLRVSMFLGLARPANVMVARRLGVLRSDVRARTVACAGVHPDRRSPGMGVNRKDSTTLPACWSNGRDARAVLGKTTLGDWVLQAEVAQAVQVGFADSESAVVLGSDASSIGHHVNKCLQVACANLRGGRRRRHALRWFKTECRNDMASGGGSGNSMERKNLQSVQTWLCDERAFVWVYEAKDVQQLMTAAVRHRWKLGDVHGVCAGA